MPSRLPSRLIGLYSPSPGCGKTTTARFLQGQDFEVVSFAAPLRAMVFSLLLDLGHNSGDAFALLHERKEEILPELGVSPRHLLRTLGTEWGRQCVHPRLWLKSFATRVTGLSLVVVDDVRFLNEANLITSLGGEVWEVRRPSHERPAEHASDGGLADWPGFAHVIDNSGGFEELEAKALNALNAQPVTA